MESNSDELGFRDTLMGKLYFKHLGIAERRRKEEACRELLKSLKLPKSLLSFEKEIADAEGGL